MIIRCIETNGLPNSPGRQSSHARVPARIFHRRYGEFRHRSDGGRLRPQEAFRHRLRLSVRASFRYRRYTVRARRHPGRGYDLRRMIGSCGEQEAQQSILARKSVVRINKHLLSLALAVALAACASRPEGVLTPVADTVPSTGRVEMLVATTRQPSENPGEMFTGERGPAPAFADITVSIPGRQQAQGRRSRVAEEIACQPGDRFRHAEGGGDRPGNGRRPAEPRP